MRIGCGMVSVASSPRIPSTALLAVSLTEMHRERRAKGRTRSPVHKLVNAHFPFPRSVGNELICAVAPMDEERADSNLALPVFPFAQPNLNASVQQFAL